MKKLYITASVAFMTLFMMSFTTVKTEADFNKVTEADLAMDAELGSFEEFQERRYTADKNEWEKRHKTWTEFGFAEHLSALGNILDRN